jgi:hypothetical protein
VSDIFLGMAFSRLFSGIKKPITRKRPEKNEEKRIVGLSRFIDPFFKLMAKVLVEKNGFVRKLSQFTTFPP